MSSTNPALYQITVDLECLTKRAATELEAGPLQANMASMVLPPASMAQQLVNTAQQQPLEVTARQQQLN
jgi:hypothetical protein